MEYILALLSTILDPWVMFGFTAQFIFFARFIIQWVASERSGRVTIPPAFWYLSVIGAIMILIYALHRQDVVFIVGQLMALGIYARNIVLDRAHSKAT